MPLDAQRLAAMRRGDRHRDREVGAGLVDPDAAGDVDEHVGGRRSRCRRGALSTASTIASRLRSMPVAVRRGGTISVGATSAWTSTSSGRVPSIAHSTQEPAAAVASSTKRAEGSVTSVRPPERISNSAISLVEPKRFLSARSVR